MGLEYYSFDKVLQELSMDEEELKRLVSEGQIRAFRDDNRMKFRRDDIEALRKGKQTEPTIILPDGDIDLSEDADLQVVDAETEETLLDLDGIDVDGDFQTDESSVPSLDLDADLGDETLTEELVFDDEDDLGLGEDATQRIDADAGLDDDFGMQTEPLSLEEDDLDDDEIEETELDDPDATFVGGDDDFELEDDGADETLVSPAPKPKPAAGRRAAAAPRTKAQPATAKPDAVPVPAAKPIGALWVIALAFITLFYVLGALTIYDYSRGSTSPVGESTSGFASDSFMNKTKLRDPGYQPAEAVAVPGFLAGN